MLVLRSIQLTDRRNFKLIRNTASELPEKYKGDAKDKKFKALPDASLDDKDDPTYGHGLDSEYVIDPEAWHQSKLVLKRRKGSKHTGKFDHTFPKLMKERFNPKYPYTGGAITFFCV